MANPVYDSRNFRIGWNGAILTEGMNSGWGDDTFMTVTPNGDDVDMKIGSCGTAGVSKLADQGGTIEVTFQQTAIALKKIDQIAATSQLMNEVWTTPYLGVFTFTDPSGAQPSFVAWNAVLSNKGTTTHQKIMGERTITWKCEKLIYGDPDSITANILDYIKG